jgi:bifunctional DNA-binding transcriptional regulator/antitoxin component of YhaV-PrlF toxin-antitoxin module
VVIPKRLRDELGLSPGPVDVVRDGAAVRIEPLTDPDLERVGDRLVIPSSDDQIDDPEVRDLRLSDQQ